MYIYSKEKGNCSLTEFFDFINSKGKRKWSSLTEIFDFINNTQMKFCDDKYFKDYTIIITGKGGTTGKSSLCFSLKEAGFKAIELAESFNIIELVDFKDYGRHVIVDDMQKVVLIILNKYRNKEVNENETMGK